MNDQKPQKGNKTIAMKRTQTSKKDIRTRPTKKDGTKDRTITASKKLEQLELKRLEDLPSGTEAILRFSLTKEGRKKATQYNQTTITKAHRNKKINETND